MEYKQYYDLEDYLFTTVHDRFHDQGYLNAFDFFCIIIWKSNRAKNNIARRILKKYLGNIEKAAYELTSGIFILLSAKERLRFLIQVWGFYISMTSAILTVLYPDEFTIYDVRVCDSLASFHKIANITDFERLWKEYQKFIQAVIAAAPSGYSLRDKDRYLWGKSFASQLSEDLKKYEQTLK